MKTTHLPFIKLYNKAIERDAVYSDERVYPAYWHQEPQALKLAKKQYQLMQQGVDEETAYVRALRYVEGLESAAYEESEKILEMMKEKGVSVVFAADEALIRDVGMWRERLADTRFSKMSLEEQGELDYLVQTRVLKWQQGERERRMKDPIFYKQFQEIRAAIFPEINTENRLKREEQLARQRHNFKVELFRKYQVNETQLSPGAPFFLEDYVFYFNKLKSEPLLNNWDEEERSLFFRWIVNTLAIRDILKSSSSSRVQAYLEDIRNKFFPMVKYPERAEEFTLPDINGIKAVLYKNDVGYRRQNDKVYVRRFYRLPALLFPETTAEPVRMYQHEETYDYFTTEMMKKSKSVEEIRKELEPKLRGGLGVQKISIDDLLRDDDTSDDDDFLSASQGGKDGKESSMVEDILKDEDSEQDTPAKEVDEVSAIEEDASLEVAGSPAPPIIRLTKKQRKELLSHSDNPDLKSMLDKVEIGLVSEEDELREECRELLKFMSKAVQKEAVYSVLGQPKVEVQDVESEFPFQINKLSGNKLVKLHKTLKEVSILGRFSTAEERQVMVEKYSPTEKNRLEQLREEYLQKATRTSYDYCVTEAEFQAVYHTRQEFLMMERAHMAVEFEQREGARVAGDWKQRDIQSLPKPDMPLFRNDSPR
eukprot:CAMPEP_0185027710 /NCGR_PEP_ID=MMETSP1103-20130426/12933_1 /TAXON_ID=36769 /ORGANISM="Paraphysomonas bandaiensis, Strain Caron Lab Isolate" /LENGTH=650 /DNA_ID=CAMNT_0027561817 /DNA_START=166 /DNA_END=2114 /DNA_ORIENTATION=+